MRMSRPWAASAASVKRKASVPYLPMIATGATTLPSDLDIFCPSASRTRAWMYTWRKGSVFMRCRPSIAMRATQKKMMSKPVTSTEVGYHVRRYDVSSGQPSVEKGHRPEENQVSRTSGSWRSGPLHFGHAVRSTRETWTEPSLSQYQAGMRWPHHSCREMHHRRLF